MKNLQNSTLKTNWPMVAISPKKPYLCSKSLKEMSEELKPYSIEEINAMIDEAERESAAGLGQDSEEMFRELEGMTLEPYTMEEIYAMVEEGERDFEAGRVYTTEEVIKMCLDGVSL